MPIVAVDDTDSRERGMCTTYVGTRLAERLESAGGRIVRRLLIRLNPAVKHKTRGNAAVAVHATDIDADAAFRLAGETVRALSAADDPRTAPGIVVADIDVAATGDARSHAGENEVDAGTAAASTLARIADRIPASVADFSRRALRERLSVTEAVSLAEAHGYRHAAFGSGGADGDPIAGRGRIGALAAVGAPATLDDVTYERISYRQLERCGTPREVDAGSVFAAADREYPVVWDTVDRTAGEVVCVPNAPGPILYGIRGDDPEACRRVTAGIESESVERAATFLTNQGTDAHLAAGTLGGPAGGAPDGPAGGTQTGLRDGAGYRVSGVVASDPEPKRGGHVHLDVAALPPAGGDGNGTTEPRSTVRAVAFSPTGRFRDHVRSLRSGDRITLCGEHELRTDDPGPDGTLKLEKFAVRGLVRTEPATPTCPACGRTMSSAGRDQGYRCRDCGTAAPGTVERSIERELELGWYEVPPSARRHVAKPLVRGGFDAPVHPER